MIARDMAKIIQASLKEGPGFNDMGISETAILHLGMYLPPNPSILEFGGGQSSYVWKQYQETTGEKVSVHIYNHDGDYVQPLIPLALQPNFRIHHSRLKQVSDLEFENVFSSQILPQVSWQKMGKILDPSHNRNYSLKNVFYEKIPSVEDYPNGVDVFILDGPFGNGRSLAFPLLTHIIKKGTIMLIDDYTHYFFEDDLRKVYNIEILYKDNWSPQHWFVCRVID